MDLISEAQLQATAALDRVEVKVTIPRSLYVLAKALGWSDAYFTWTILGAAQGDMNALFSGWSRADKIVEDCKALQEKLPGGDWA